ncbi:hypothetical protein BFX06_00330 [Sulfobacillus thermosulfidooxidans]|nr:hypothetical protein BFX05_06735 [Sulfobacillus thermosulfidooxidans]OLZ18721.1 hypothetical protein BFX06_00330 [Sulfobacillus thermosulfidooxidans]OLZ20329.1 hypothetical protein BFX07_01470 [Sulfobacillus thermosulfidooxidans]
MWAFGRHLNRTTENLAHVMAEEFHYEIIPFSTEVSRLRRIPAMVASVRMIRGKLKAFSSIHPWTKKQVHLPSELENIPTMVIMGSQIIGNGPHFFYQDLDVSSILRDREQGKPTFMYDDVPLSLLQKLNDMQFHEYRQAQAIFTMSDWVRTSIIKSGAIKSQDVHTVHAGSNLGAHFSSNPYAEKNLAAQTLVFVGRDFQRKGGNILLRAWPKVLQELPLAQLKIIGPYREDIGQELSPSIHVLGPLSNQQIIHEMSQCTGLVIPSLWEPYGIAFLEAMSMGLPVIGTRHMAMPEFIVPGTGYLPKPYEVDELAEAMIRLLTQTHTTWKMSRNAFLHAQAFQWSQVAAKMDRVLTSIMKN